jgi:hypothetical protein
VRLARRLLTQGLPLFNTAHDRFQRPTRMIRFPRLPEFLVQLNYFAG